MSQLTLAKVVLGLNADPTRNFLLDTDGAGGLRVRRNADGSGGNILTFGADGQRNSWKTGEVIQTIVASDAGGSTTNTGAYTNVTQSLKNITPKSTNSTIIVECVFSVAIQLTPATNTYGYAVLYDQNNNSTFGTNPTFGIGTSSGGNSLNVSGTVMGIVTNNALAVRQFGLRALSGTVGNTTSLTNHFWKITEVQN